MKVFKTNIVPTQHHPHTITQDCQNMDDSCHWECKETTTASYPDNYTTTSKHPNDEKFCLGGTDMYMQGFSVSFLKQKL